MALEIFFDYVAIESKHISQSMKALHLGEYISEGKKTALSRYTYSRLAKIDTAKIDTFYEISRNFEKINNTLFGLHKTRILGLRI